MHLLVTCVVLALAAAPLVRLAFADKSNDLTGENPIALTPSIIIQFDNKVTNSSHCNCTPGFHLSFLCHDHSGAGKAAARPFPESKTQAFFVPRHLHSSSETARTHSDFPIRPSTRSAGQKARDPRKRSSTSGSQAAPASHADQPTCSTITEYSCFCQLQVRQLVVSHGAAGAVVAQCRSV